MEFAKRSFDSKRNYFIEFVDKLELFYHETLGIKPNNKDQKRDLEKRKVMINASLELHTELLNLYKNQYLELTRAQKKKKKV